MTDHVRHDPDLWSVYRARRWMTLGMALVILVLLASIAVRLLAALS